MPLQSSTEFSRGLRLRFWLLSFLSLCVLAAGAWFIQSIISRQVHHLVGSSLLTMRDTQAEIARQWMESRRRLQEKLGEGGMGEVYVGYHALMRRPTAIKLLRQVDELSLGRFEREVKLTCQLSHPNTIAGTPNYMSPEVVEQRGEIDHRSDLYAVGCIAFFLLSGRCVFEKDSVISVLMAHRNEPAPSLADIGVNVPPEMEAVVAACLAKDPADRHADARSLAAALDAVPGAVEWTETQAAEWWSRVKGAPGQVMTRPSDPDVNAPALRTTAEL